MAQGQRKGQQALPLTLAAHHLLNKHYLETADLVSDLLISLPEYHPALLSVQVQVSVLLTTVSLQFKELTLLLILLLAHGLWSCRDYNEIFVINIFFRSSERRRQLS